MLVKTILVILFLNFATASDDNPTMCEKMTTTICQNSDQTITCSPNYIYVVDGCYGRENKETYPGDFPWFWETGCALDSAKEIIKNKCDCKFDCTIEASNNYFDGENPCSSPEYVKVTYACISSTFECDNIPVSDSCSAEPTDSPTQNTSFTISTNSMPYATSQSNENTQTAASDSIKQTEAGTESSETSPFTATNPITENETTDGAKSITTDMRSQLSTWTATTSTIESATTENPEGNVKDQLSQLSACDIVGIVIGVLVLLALITLGAFLYVKKRQDAKKSFVYVCTKCGNQSFEMKLVDNNSNNTYATSDTDSSSTEVKQSHVYQNVETSCKMTANVLYDSYQPKGEVETKESECIYAEPDK